jgi:catechol O-methyltransferase
LQGNPQAILEAIDSYAKTKKRMMVFQKNKLDISREVLEKVNPKPKVLVELGTYVGNSAVAWGAMLKEINGSSADEVKVFSMELEKQFAEIANDFLDLAGLQGTVQIVQGQSSDSLKRLKEDKKLEKIDVLFLDHWEKFYLSDLQLCEDLGLFKKGTVIIADNTDMPGAPDYLKYVRSGGRENKVKYTTQTLSTNEQTHGPVSFLPLIQLSLQWIANSKQKLLEVTYVVDAS